MKTKKKMTRNTQDDLVNALKHIPMATENELMIEAFDYDRGASTVPNMKYARLLRRAVDSGKIARVEASAEGTRSRFFYYVPR